MAVRLRSTKYLAYLVPNREKNVNIYFKNVEARNWQLKHYLNYVLKSKEEIPSWATAYGEWTKSLEIIKNNKYKSASTTICGFCRELLNIGHTFEGSVVLERCQQWYDNFYERNFDLQFSERVKQLEENIFEVEKIIFSSQKMTELLQNNGKRIASEGEASDRKRSRHDKYYDSDVIQDDDFDYDEDVPLHDLIQKESGWVLSTSRDVKDILESVIEDESNKQNKKPTPEQKALRRHIASKIIDLTSIMKDYFTDVEQQDIIHSINVTEFNSDINDFIDTIEKLIARGEPNKAYLKCLKIHTLAEPNSDKYKISKVYGDFLYKTKNGKNFLNLNDNGYTETDIVVKAVGYIIDGLVPDFTFSEKWGESFSPPSKSNNYIRGRRCDVRILGTEGKDLAEWEFSQKITPTKTVSDRCRSNRVNQAIFNELLKVDKLKDHVGMQLLYIQMGGVNGQLLSISLKNGYYIISPGPTFVLPTSFCDIKKLKNVVKIFYYIMKIYQNFDDALIEIGQNKAFEKVFNSNGNKKCIDQKYTELHDPWWTPKKERVQKNAGH